MQPTNYGVGKYSTPHHNTLLPASMNDTHRQSPYATLDRGLKTLQRNSGMHTLPPMPKSFKFQSIATVTARMLWASSNRKEEELAYLGAVERGDIEEVRVILSKRHTTSDKENMPHTDPIDTRDILFVDDSTDDELSNDAGKSKSDNFLAGGKKTSPSANKSTRNTLSILVDSVRDTKKKANSKKSSNFDKNCRDPWGRSALFIAISKKNLEMIELLLEKEVELGECLYHAIEFGYYDVVKLLIKASERRDQVITGEDSFYTPGLTPIQLAAHKNDFIMLKILHSNGFRIMGKCEKFGSRNSYKHEEGSVLHKAWHETNNRLLFYRAMSSPAYLIMMFTEDGFDDYEGRKDFLERLFSLYDKLRKKAQKDMDSRGVYLEIAEQVETFSCRLLDEVRSADDLASILRFNPPGLKTQSEVSHAHTLRPIARACDVHMKQFVAHQHCQLALSSIRLGNVFESGSGIKTYLTRFFLALMFPILSLVYVIAPQSRIGKLTKNPMINLSCHMMSEIMFVVLIFIRLILLSFRQCDCLGTPPHVMEIIILLWVVGKALNVFKSLSRQSLWSNFTNIWKLNDIATLSLFIIVFAFRMIDIYTTDGIRPSTFHWDCPEIPKNSTWVNNCNREKWTGSQKWPVMLSEGCMGLLHLLVIIRAMELMYIDRTFGPLQLSLDKMLRDTVRFLIVFSISFIAFACVMSQLYWPYGKPRQRLYGIPNSNWSVCSEDKPIADHDDCEPVYSQIHNAILEQFWTLFGYGYKSEPPQAVSTPQGEAITEVVGMIAAGLFHIWAVVVMLNMLIAMLSFSFERVRGNAELEWKFHRTNTWLRFIRTEVHPRPPPMNLIPSRKIIMKFAKYLKRSFLLCKSSHRTQGVQFQMRPEVGYQTSENMKYVKVLKRVTDRYLKKHLLEEFQHDEDTHFLLQKRIPSRSASPSTEVTDNNV